MTDETDNQAPNHADDWHLIPDATSIEEGGEGVRFDVLLGDGPATAFVVRVDGLLRAYVNRCRHVPVELDWNPGQFLDDSGLYIVCATHGAMYDGATGACMGGPCDGKPLIGIDVMEQAGQVFWRPSSAVQPLVV